MDKKRKILTCLKFGDPIDFCQLQEKSGIKEHELAILLDILAKEKYVEYSDGGLGLYSLSALERYDIDKNERNSPTIINIIICIIAGLTLLVSIATLLSPLYLTNK